VEVFVPAKDTSLAVDQVLATWLHSVRERGVEHVALLLATRKGKADRAGLNVTHLNARAQALVNPPQPGAAVAGSQLRLGDRIVVRKNLVFLDPEAGDYRRLCNGDMGWLDEAIAVEDRFEARTVDLVLQMDDGTRVRVPAAYSRALELGYALTCHSAQGSEFEHAIVALQGPGTSFQSRRMLYTACSRARELLTLFGSDSDLSSVAALATPERHSYLKEAALAEAEALAADRGSPAGGSAAIAPAASPAVLGGHHGRDQAAPLVDQARALDPQDAPFAQAANDFGALAGQAAAPQR
jgi:ATP-dependent exoDNAse (exonuclease V) alpha subunit